MPFEELTGTTAALADLVYLPFTSFVADMQVSGNTVVFRLKPGIQLSPGLRVQTIYAKQLADLHVEDGQLVGRLVGDHPARPQVDQILVDLGPYEQVTFSKERLVLRRRSGSGIERIEVIATHSEEEEWRRFLAREVDVIPVVKPGPVRYLRDVPSVRLVPVGHPPTSAVLLRVNEGPLADLRLRRAVSLALRRKAIATVVIGDDSLAVDAVEDVVAARALVTAAGRPAPLRLALQAAATADTRAALVIEEQLANVDLAVRINVGTLQDLIGLVDSGQFDLIFLSADFAPESFSRFRSRSERNVSGYSSPEFDLAVDHGDADRAIEILQRDLPLVPLYRTPEYVAINRELCGAQPQDVNDNSWLAAVHRCAEGERE
jgi:ABC-type oligopeptide transport system substrate-binding subunit